MLRTRAFRLGNGQVVLIPAELAYADTDLDLEITRLGDVITIFPARPRLSDVVAELGRMSKPGQVEKRQPMEMPTRGRSV